MRLRSGERARSIGEVRARGLEARFWRNIRDWTIERLANNWVDLVKLDEVGLIELV